MQTLTVHASRTYEVLVGRGLLSCAGALCREVNGGARALLVSDSNVGPLYTMNVAGSLRDAGYTVKTYMFPAGEASKTLDTVAGRYAQLAALYEQTASSAIVGHEKLADEVMATVYENGVVTVVNYTDQPVQTVFGIVEANGYLVSKKENAA